MAAAKQHENKSMAPRKYGAGENNGGNGGIGNGNNQWQQQRKNRMAIWHQAAKINLKCETNGENRQNNAKEAAKQWRENGESGAACSREIGENRVSVKIIEWRRAAGKAARSRFACAAAPSAARGAWHNSASAIKRNVWREA
jgi:hypothetical protein